VRAASLSAPSETDPDHVVPPLAPSPTIRQRRVTLRPDHGSVVDARDNDALVHTTEAPLNTAAPAILLRGAHHGTRAYARMCDVAGDLVVALGR
jgi:hypothetical protein